MSTATKKHFSPVSQKWVPCHATKRPCRYGEAAHKTNAEIAAIKEEQKLSIDMMSAGEVVEVYGDTMEKHVGDSYKDAHAELALSATEMQGFEDKVLEGHIHTPNKFKEQFRSLGASPSVLGKLEIKSIPSFDEIRDEVKNADPALKEELGKASMKNFEKEQRIKELATQGLQLT